MNLSTLPGHQNHNTVSSGSANGSGAVPAVPHQNNTVSLQTGQTIQGEVVSVKGNEITLSLDNGNMVSARLDQGIQVTAGQILTFEVKSNTGARLALSPLYENLGHDPNILKALTAAGMPATSGYVNLVSALMREGLPVDKHSLQSFGRQMMLTPDADPVTLAQMKRLQIPATPENIAQFEAYKNYEHQISRSVLEITNGLTDTFAQMIAGGDVEGAANLFKQVLLFLAEEGIAPERMAMTEKTPDEMAGDERQEVMKQSADGQVEAAVTDGGRTGTPGVAVQTDLSGILLEEWQGKPLTAEQNILSSGQPHAGAELLRHIMQDIAADTVNGEILQVADNMPLYDGLPEAELSPEARMQLADLLREAGFSEQLTSGVSSGNMTRTALLQEMAKELVGHSQVMDQTKLVRVFGSKEYQFILKNEISRQWLLQPEEVAGDRQVEELYRRLNEHTNKLANALSQASRADTPLANTVNNLSNNINFMNQLNQIFTYIQLPLKMNGENTHGELYVYTNKKNLAGKDGNVSALLHLDMEHLGTVDVYVAMQNKNVSTKFYLKDDSVIDLIAENIYILNQRLSDKGYGMNCEFVLKDGEKTAMEEMLEANKNVSVMASYSFDARA